MMSPAPVSFRSLLQVAGDDRSAIGTALNGAADAILLDLAFGAASSRSGAARLVLRELADEPGEGIRKPMFVRIGDLASGQADADLDAAVLVKPSGVMTYRLTGAGDLRRLGSRLSVWEALHGLPDGGTGIIAAIDSPVALLRIGEAVISSRRLVAITLDAAALTGALGSTSAGSDRHPSEPLRLARSLCLYAAAAAQVPAVDALSPQTDLESFRSACVAAKRDGFTAKLVSPGQIEIANEVFVHA